MDTEFKKQMMKVLFDKYSYMELVYMKDKYLKELKNEKLDSENRNDYETILELIEEVLKNKNEEME